MPNPPPLLADRLMAHLRILCKQTPPRQPTSEGERSAGEYVKGVLDDLGLTATVQSFKGLPTLGLPGTIAALIGLAGFPLGWFAGPIGKWVGGLLLMISAWAIFRLYALRPVFFLKWLARWPSQNVLSCIPPRGEPRRRIYLLGHLDAQKQRFLMPPPNPALMKPSQTAVIVLAWLAGLSMWIESLSGWGLLWFQILVAAFLLGTVGMLLLDERQPTVEGANDNASAAAILLGIAEVLKQQPLQNSEVHLLFTGCEEVGGHGLQAYLREYAPPVEDSYWIDLELVGAGALCYATHHGVTYLSGYRPGPRIQALAEETARRHPEYELTGRDMLVFEEIGLLRQAGHEALCLMGHDARGNLVNWHRTSDTLENLEPGTLERAAGFTLALLKTIDAL
ncbi:MAG: M28 family peptidase [Anaerolineales bacterium]|nr:M28 family peptidase [Anaerolineales bacterium]